MGLARSSCLCIRTNTRSGKFETAFSSGERDVAFTAQQVAEILMNSQSLNDPESNVDSGTGEISSGEGFELDRELQGESEVDSEARWVSLLM